MSGDWQQTLIDIASQAGDGDGAHDIHHLHRVWHNAQRLLAAHPEADALVVMAGCYLHDLVNLPKNHPERSSAARQSALAASKLLAARGFPEERIGAVAHAIEAHSFSAALPATTIEAKIVQDADRLDALGAVGLARLFYIAGQMGSALAHPDDPLATNRSRDDRQYALDHIDVKLTTLPATMQTAAGRAQAESRMAMLLAFRDDFAREWSPVAMTIS